MKTEEYAIKVPVSDWMKEYIREEVDVSTEDKIVELATKDKMPTSQIARMVIIAREAGAAPEEIIPANKLLLNAGGAASIQQIIATRYRELEIANNRTVKVREFVGPMREVHTQVKADEIQPVAEAPAARVQANELVAPVPDLEEVTLPEETEAGQQPVEPGFVVVQSEEACQRAIDYLLSRIPGYVYSRLAIIAVNEGDVAQVAERLKAEIDRVVRELT